MREYHCRNCGLLLYRTDAPSTLTHRIQTVCPDRRCQRMNNYRFCDNDRPGNRRLFLDRWREERAIRANGASATALR
jgi:hypothetical protein